MAHNLAHALAHLAATAGPIVAGIALAGLVAVAVARRAQARRLADGARLVKVLIPPKVDAQGAATLWTNLVALLRPAWRRVLGGQPHLGFELTATGGGIALALPEHYPLRTEHKVDSLRPLIGALAGLGETESACVQILGPTVTDRRLARLHKAAAARRAGRPASRLGRLVDLATPSRAPRPPPPTRRGAPMWPTSWTRPPSRAGPSPCATPSPPPPPTAKQPIAEPLTVMRRHGCGAGRKAALERCRALVPHVVRRC